MPPITIRYSFRPVRRSLTTGQVADLFGLSDEEPAHTVADGVVIDPRPGDVVLFTGLSGSGKSSLLKRVGEQVGAVDIMSLELPDVPLVETLAGAVESRLELLAACGLSEARLLLRTPAELSDGQRYRFRLALGLNRAGANGFLLADEFAAYLDRTLAKVVAYNLRKLATRSGIGMLLATTHDDIVDDANPNIWVRCAGEGQVCVERRDVKKKRSASVTTYGSRTAPAPTGRISLGGIIAATI